MKNTAATRLPREDGAGAPSTAGGAEPLLDGQPAFDSAEAPWRTLEYFASTRVIVASALVLASAAAGVRPILSPGGPQWALLASLLYFMAGAGFAGLALYAHRRFLAQVIQQGRWMRAQIDTNRNTGAQRRQVDAAHSRP